MDIKMKKNILLIGLIIGQQAIASQLSLAEFKQQTKLYYADLEVKQTALNTALDQKQHPNVLIEKACSYSTGLKQLKAFAKENRQLDYAQEEFVFVRELDERFNQSLQDLGTSYEKGCLKK
jgi:hypothetical protein